MNWKTLAALPILGLLLWIVVSAIEFGNRVGASWNDGTMTTLVNGLVMMCWGTGMLFAFVAALLIGVALATRILQTPLPRGSAPAEPRLGAGYGSRPGLWDRMRGRTGPGWEYPVTGPYGDQYGGPDTGTTITVLPPVPGARSMLPGQGWNGHALPAPRASGAFDGMDDEGPGGGW